VSDSDVEEVLSLFNGQVLDVCSLDLEGNLYLPEHSRSHLGDEEYIVEDIWKSGSLAIKKIQLDYSSVRELSVSVWHSKTEETYQLLSIADMSYSSRREKKAC
ncbi:Hypothetical protein POVR2_LOCUS47, partial [uncultured virus]